MARFKLWRMAGGGRGLIALLLTALVCGMAATGAQRTDQGELRLAVCDLDESAASQELVARLSGLGGLKLLETDASGGEEMLLTGEAEGLLTIEAGYPERLRKEETPMLRFEGSAAAMSAQGVREMVAGQVSVQRSRLRAEEQAEELLGRTLTKTEREELLACIEAVEPRDTRLYTIRTSDGTPAAIPFVLSPGRFAVLAVFFTLLTTASWSANRNGRRIEKRMGAIPRGRLLALGSDCLGLTCLGGAVWLAVLLPGGLPGTAGLWTMATYSFCGAALSMFLARLGAMEGRIDGMAPFLALILCLLGGCFMDLEELLPQLADLSRVLPTGLAVRGSEGELWAGGVLLLEGGALLALCGIKREK